MDSRLIYTVYRATNTLNGKVYIGFDSDWPKRKAYHLCVYKKPTKDTRAFYAALKKYGPDAFIWDVLYQSWDSDHTLNIMEPYFIAEHQSYGAGYNMTPGGEGCLWRRFSDETIQKLREANRGENNPQWGKKQSPEHVASRTRRGKDHPSWGRKKTEEEKLKWSKSIKTTLDSMTPEERRAKFGHEISTEERQRRAALTVETRRKNGTSNKTFNKVVRINGIQYPSKAEAARQLGMSVNQVHWRLNSDDYSEWCYQR